MRETDVNRNAAAFFFLEPVGIDPRQGFDKRGFAVIDMARRADNDVFGHGFVRSPVEPVEQGFRATESACPEPLSREAARDRSPAWLARTEPHPQGCGLARQ
jgi:hypothetical protein